MMFIKNKKLPLCDLASPDIGTYGAGGYGMVGAGGRIRTASYNFNIKKIDKTQGKEIFNSTELMNDANKLEGHFTEFANHLMDANATVNALLNKSDASAVFGVYGAALLNLWNENASTFGDFKLNFEAWSRAIAVIATQNENTEAEAIRQYADRGDTLSYRSYSNGSYSYGKVSDIPTDTEIHFDDDKTADLLVESTSAPVVDNSYSISQGDSCFVNSVEYEFLGRDSEHNYLVKDGLVYRQEGDNVVPLNVSVENFQPFDYGVEVGEEWHTSISTTTEDATNMGLPDANTITRGIVAGDTVQYDGTDYTYLGRGDGNISYFEKDGQVYMEQGDGVVFVDQSVDIVKENIMMYKSELHTNVDTSTAYTLPQNITAQAANEYFQSAVNNREPLIQINNTLESEAMDWITVDIKAGESGTVVLAYDKGTDMYYQVGDDGSYVVEPGNGFKPEDLVTYDVANSKHTDVYSQM